MFVLTRSSEVSVSTLLTRHKPNQTPAPIDMARKPSLMVPLSDKPKHKKSLMGSLFGGKEVELDALRMYLKQCHEWLMFGSLTSLEECRRKERRYCLT